MLEHCSWQEGVSLPCQTKSLLDLSLSRAHVDLLLGRMDPLSPPLARLGDRPPRE